MKPLAELTPAGTQTYSKSPSRFGAGCPETLVSGRGAFVDGDDGRRFIDYVSALGAVILGYGDPDVDAAIAAQLARGLSFSLPTRLEGEVAELIGDLFPDVDMVRFQKNGKDACDAAVRLARAVTGRDRVVTIGYHGGSDWTVADTNPRGVPETARQQLVRVPYGDLERLRTALSGSWPTAGDNPHEEAACLIMEPVVAGNPELPPPGYLEACRTLCTRYGALLIFDEVVTGFRFEDFTAAKHYGVIPDLYAAGKAMANGMPLSIVAGPREIMKLMTEGVFCSTTFGGETLSLAAAKATITKLRDEQVPAPLAAWGRTLMAGYRAAAAARGLSRETEIVGYPSRPVITWLRADLRAIFETAMIQRGILMQGYHNITLAHVRDPLVLQATLDAYAGALDAVNAHLGVPL